MTPVDPVEASPEITASPDTKSPLVAQFAGGRRIRRKVGEGGLLYLDRSLPFLVVHRRVEFDDQGAKLVTAASAYAVMGASKEAQRQMLDVVAEVEDFCHATFGAFLMVEVWVRPPELPSVLDAGATGMPAFRVFGRPQGAAVDVLLDVLEVHLGKLKIGAHTATVERQRDARGGGRKLKPMVAPQQQNEHSTLWLGIEVEPCYRSPDGSEHFPAVVKALRTGLHRALRHTCFRFASDHTKFHPKNYQSLGRHAFGKSVWEVDAQLDRISSSFDMLLEVNPTNTAVLWREFRKSRYEKLPPLRYKPLTIDPVLSKRALFSIPVERVEDPTVADLLTRKQEELDRQLTMLADRGTPRFLLGGMQLYGVISSSLLRAAEEVFERVPASSRARSPGRKLPPEEFAKLARDEIAYYRRKLKDVDATAVLTPNVMSGLMVSRGHLLVSSETRTPASRADALIQHEVGTHLVTYYNGKQQRFLQLKSGLAGYEELQEGLAVLAEHLVGGMTPSRLRVVAGRVVAAAAVVDGATFVDTFRLLCRYGFTQSTAFDVALRVYRGGGFIKDCIYLRGLEKLLAYLAAGEELEPLFVGKIALAHAPMMAELRTRGAVLAPAILPRYLSRPDVQRRLSSLRSGRRVYQLLAEESG